MDEESVEPGRLLRQHEGCGGVDGEAEVAFPFRLIHCRVSGGVDDNGGLHLPNQIPDGLLAAEITFVPADRNHIGTRLVQAGKLPPYLSVFSGDQDSHAIQKVV